MPGTFTYTRASNIVVVTAGTSGAPATFADLLTADRTSTLELLAAWTPNSNTKALTYQIQPVDLLALLISFIIASKTTETDYIFIAGTDAWGNAQTESIDVSAGNGTYVSTKRFRTITNIDCSDNAGGSGTVWADGNVQVTQPQWGIIWSGATGQWRLSCSLSIGDGSTSTYFFTTKEQIYFDNNFNFSIFANATFTMGYVNADNKGYGGSYISLYPSGNMNITVADATAVGNFYGGIFECRRNSRLYFKGTDNIRNMILRHGTTGVFSMWYFSATTIYLSDVTFDTFYTNLLTAQISQCARVHFVNTSAVFSTGSGTYDLTDLDPSLASTNIIGATTGATVYVTDITDPTTEGAPTGTAIIWFRHRCNIKIVDSVGNDMEGATVTCLDKNGDEVFSVLTGADGTIVQQYINTDKYLYDPDYIHDTFNPHQIIISKNGYKTLVLENITVDSQKSWHFELQQVMDNNFSHLVRINTR